MLFRIRLQLPGAANGIHCCHSVSILVQTKIQTLFVFRNIRNRNLTQDILGNGIKNRNLLLYRNRRGILLLQHFNNAGTLIQSILGILIQIRAELGKALKLTILRVHQLQSTCHLLHGLNLRISSDSGNRNTRVYRRHDSGVEKLGLQEYLPVCNRNDIRRNIS